MKQLLRFIDAFSEGLGRLCAWLTLVMAGLLLAVVVLRYGFSLGSIALQESVMYLHGIAFMLGAGYTLKQQGHVRVDVFYRNFSERRQALVDFVGTLVLLLPVTLFIGFVSWDYVMMSWARGEASAEAGGLAFVYVQKTLLLLFVVSMSLAGIAELIRNGAKLFGKEGEWH
ncbi:TRAP transporter small permease subunit [Paraferrimonas sedimenticola]|uniref:TRAP transporter small permease protein n=1 Tax=Paraferrimonas sedimenticola TaxID=375674 RepID=A0AA37RX94_9GAMM|nr:TRAP transporter small permease subunit [Paraferrimonas sedimenticola]GLP96796.1 hypothetical protein GCM10007895_21020 [Paraferrimonas sedimenticola]